MERSAGLKAKSPKPVFNPSMPPSTYSKSVLIVDDHMVIAQTVALYITSHFPKMKISTAQNVKSALGLCETENFDLLILDLDMDGDTGLSMLEQLRDLKHKPAIMIFSMYLEHSWIVRSMRVGANGYVSKKSSKDELMEGITSLLSGRKYISADVAHLLANDSSNLSTGNEPHLTLTKKEFEILIQIAAGLSLKEVAFNLNISVKTAAVHKFNLTAKMGFKSTVEFHRYCVSHGLLAG